MNIRTRVLTSFALVVVFAVVVQPSAFAVHTQRRTDPNDVSGPLDIKEVSMRVRAARVVCRARIFGQIEKADFDTGFLCGLDFRGRGGEEDAFARLYFDGVGIKAELRRKDSSSFDYVRDVPARVNLDKDSVVVKIPRSEIPGRARFLNWRATTQFYDSASCSSGCVDYARDDFSDWYRYTYH